MQTNFRSKSVPKPPFSMFSSSPPSSSDSSKKGKTDLHSLQFMKYYYFSSYEQDCSKKHTSTKFEKSEVQSILSDEYKTQGKESIICV